MDQIPTPLPLDVTPQPEGKDEFTFMQYQRLESLVFERASRLREGLRLYEPLPAQADFHASMHRERILRGSNRGGKTVPAAVEAARAVTGQDPYGKYPQRDGRGVAVAQKGKLVAEVLWRKLSMPGAFKIIPDEQTGLYRAYRPWLLSDIERSELVLPAPPLIPPRFIASIAYENKKLNQPEKVIFKNGWELLFFSSEASPPQGMDVDFGWFDEEILNEVWYGEMAARLLDRRGRFWWSCTPQNATVQLFELHCRAVDEDPLVKEFVILLRSNPHIIEQEKLDLAQKITSEDERLVRIEGEFAIAAYKVYPEYQKAIHNCPNMAIPENWMRLCAIDPGRQVCAVLFAAVPPNNAHIYFYDEIYIRTCNAARFAEAMQLKCAHHDFHIFLIDGHAGVQGEIGSGKSVQAQYRDALKERKVRSRTTGSGFRHGSDDPAAGILAVKEWLRIGSSGKPRVLVVKSRCPNFEREIERYHNKRVGGIITDRPEKKNDHLMDCARYIAMYDPKYQKPRPVPKQKSPAVRSLEAKRARQRARNHGETRSVNLGPGGGDYGTRY